MRHSSKKLDKSHFDYFTEHGFTDELITIVMDLGWDTIDIENFILLYNHQNNKRVPIPIFKKKKGIYEEKMERRMKRRKKKKRKEKEGKKRKDEKKKKEKEEEKKKKDKEDEKKKKEKGRDSVGNKDSGDERRGNKIDSKERKSVGENSTKGKGKSGNVPGKKGKLISKRSGQKTRVNEPLVHLGGNTEQEMDRFFTEGRRWDERHGNEVRRLYEEGRRDEEVNASEVNPYEVNASEVNASEVNEDIQTGEGDQRSDSDSIVRSEVNASEATENRENAESAVADAIVENVSQASNRNIETGDSEEQSDSQGNGGNDIAHGASGGNAQSGGGGSSFESERRFDCRFCPGSFLMY